MKLFGTDLVIYDKQKQCLLGDGDYELLMDELVHPRNLPRKFPSWEQIGDISEVSHHLTSSPLNLSLLC